MFIGLGLGINSGRSSGVDVTSLYVVGDSTAAENGKDTTDGGWSLIVSGDASASLTNAGVPGQSIQDCADGVVALGTQRRSVTILMDNANAGETASGWLTQAARIVALQPNILIWPQCGVTDGSMSGADLTRMSDINAGIIANFPNNTFDVTEQAALIAALSNANTRSDGLHRNDFGQSVEALFASSWLVRKGWRSLRTETVSLAARMTGSLTDKRKSYINALIERHVKTGFWAITDGYYCEAQFDEQAANLNWKSSSYTLTKSGTVTFSADAGHTSDGSTGYMGTGFDVTSLTGASMAQNSAGVHVYHLTTPAESKVDIGTATSGINLSTRNADNSRSYRIFQSSTSFGSGGVSGAQAAFLVRRDASNIYPQFGAGELAAISSASITPAGGELRIGVGNSKQRAFAAFGGGWTAEQKRRVYNAETAYLKAIGVAV